MDAEPRFATLHDLSGILALYRELRPNDPELPASDSRVLLSKLLDNPAIAFVVCECEGIVASTCMLAVVPNLANGGRPFGVIEHVVTLRQFQRRGLGRSVLSFALGRAWAAGCCTVTLLSGAQRAGAHGPYESAGFDGDVERGFVAKPRRLD